MTARLVGKRTDLGSCSGDAAPRVNIDAARSIPRLNELVAMRLRETADVIAAQQANVFRVNAYRRAAETIENLTEDIGALVRREGLDGLVALPHVGRGIGSMVEQIVRTGRSPRLDRLRGDAQPEALLQAVVGIGPELARRIHEELGIETLEALEIAAFDGRLARIPGIGPRRLEGIKAGLARILQRRPQGRTGRPDVGVVLAIDEEYRTLAAAGRLPQIAPRRFNPDQRAWLPVLHRDSNGWHFTALFSNTARAHALGRTHDWVVVYFYNGEHEEGQHTVVTERAGKLAGSRVVRGREPECAAHYAAGAPSDRP